MNKLSYKIVGFSVIFLTFVIFVGCASQSRRQQLYSQFQFANNSTNSCMQAFMQTAVFNKLSEKLIYTKNDPRMIEKLALKTYATEKDVKVIFESVALLMPCRKRMIQEFGKVHPDFVTVLANVFVEATADMVAMINKEMAFGEANQNTLNRINKMDPEFRQIGKRITSQRNHLHQYEVSRRQRAAQALQSWSYQQKVLDALQQLTIKKSYSSIMNCKYTGNTVSCIQF